MRPTERDGSRPISRLAMRRRDVLTAIPAAALLGGVGAVRPATAQSDTPVGAAMVARAGAFLAALDDAQRAAATFAFTDPTRRAWNYMLGARTAPGLPLERMTDVQQTAALDLLATGLNGDGMDKADRVMRLQEALNDRFDGNPRSRDRFSVAIFGTPSMDAPWAWRFEGHHLTLSFTLVGTTVVSVTPSSFSSDPNEVFSGVHQGLVALVDEEALGRRLFADLSATNRRFATIAASAPGNVLALAGREAAIIGTRVGVPLADMAPTQADLALRLLEVYAVDHLVGPLADEQRARIAEGDIMATRFGWAGSETPGEMIYYRLHGDTFLVEFASLRNQPLHLHTIRHDTDRNLGDHIVG